MAILEEFCHHGNVHAGWPYGVQLRFISWDAASHDGDFVWKLVLERVSEAF
jgi:hypothetical protein